MKKRLLSILLCLVMVAGMLPSVAFAEGGTVEPTHTHCVCGGDTDVGDHTTHTNVTYQPWDGTSAIDYGDDNTAYVCLTDNVTIQKSLEIQEGKTLYLCLNGKTFASNGTKKIEMRENSRFILCDCVGGGTIDGADNCWGGAGIYLHNSTMDMYGGKIIGGHTGNGGGGAIALDDVNCIFNMYGGEISGNKADRFGGAIFLNGTLQSKKGGTVNLYGGTIKNNSAQLGGAIYAVYGGTVNLCGGEISGNKAARNGGAVYMFRATSTLNLSGGTIKNNTAGSSGGAVYFNTTSDGKIQGILNISGNPVVKDNTVSDKANNIAMKTGKTLSIVEAMTDGASVGITTESTNYPVVFSNAYDTDYKDCFFADDAAADVEYNADKKLQLAVHTHNLTPVAANPATCTEDGNKAYYVCSGCSKWYADAAGNEEITDPSSVVIEALGHDYTQKVETEDYLKTAASNCTEHNVYWYACSRCDANAKDDAAATDKYYTGTTAGNHSYATAWSSNESGHWHECSLCHDKKDEAAHTPDREAATETEPVKCSECDYEIAPALGMADYILEMPVSIAVKLTGDKKPAKETFKFEIYDLGVEDAAFEIVNDTVVLENLEFDENGVAFADGIIKIKVTGEEQLFNLTEGFKVRMVKGTAKGWTYASEQWYVEPFFKNDALDVGIAVKEIVDGEISETYANGMSFSLGYEAVTEPGTPQTGDSSMMVLWIALLVVSGAGATAIYSRKRKSSAK